MAALRQAPPGWARLARGSIQRLNTSVTAEAMRSAKQCAVKFDVAGTPAVQLVDLVRLYAFVGDTIDRRRALDRVLTVRDLPPRQHGQALILALGAEISAAGDHFGMIDGAERVVAQIDALPDSLSDLKLAAHSTMLGQYEYLDVDLGLRKHATDVIDIARRMQRSDAMIAGFVSLARASADLLHPDSALMILDNAERELGKDKVAERFGDFRQRYALIGTKAAAISGKWWLNTDGSTTAVHPGDGKVRLVEFTAHWCGPCKNSYPGVRSLAERFRGMPFEGVMVTSTTAISAISGICRRSRKWMPIELIYARAFAAVQDGDQSISGNAKGMSIGQPLADL